MNKVIDTIFACSAAQQLSQVFVILAVVQMRCASLEGYVIFHALCLVNNHAMRGR